VEPEQINPFLNSVYSSPLVNRQKLSQLLLRPGVDIRSIRQWKEMQKTDPVPGLFDHEKEVLEQAEIQIKYETYIQKEKELVKRMNELEHRVIPENFNFENLVSLSSEARQKFLKIRPRTIGQASRIS